MTDDVTVRVYRPFFTVPGDSELSEGGVAPITPAPENLQALCT